MTRTRTKAYRTSPTSTSTNGTHGFNVATRYAAETAVVSLMDPAVLPGQPPVDLGGRITIQSLYSDAARDAIRKAQASITIVDGKVEMTDEAAVSSLLEQTIAATVSWNLERDGTPIPCTPEEIRTLYTDPRTAWIQTQVRTAYLDLARFFTTGTGS